MAKVEDEERAHRSAIIDRILLDFPSRRSTDQGRNYARRFASIPTEDLELVVDGVLKAHEGRFAPPSRVFLARWEAIRGERYGSGPRDVLGGPDHRGGQFMTVPELRREYAKLPEWALCHEPLKAEPGERWQDYKARLWSGQATRLYAAAITNALRLHDPEFKRT